MTENNINHLGLKLSWFPASEADAVEPLLNNWLTDTGSLTERLQANCRQFSVKLLAQGLSAITENESQLLYGQFGNVEQQTEVREVLLMADDHPWVFARSLMPQPFLQEAMTHLKDLGDKPLGKIIFNDPRFRRQKFELTKIDSTQLPTQWNLPAGILLWGRRSLFTFSHYHMMVSELFLPASPAYSRLV
ncbi:MAG: chorismate--pyruvate lyase family protein [Aestuariibacter sp.]